MKTGPGAQRTAVHVPGVVPVSGVCAPCAIASGRRHAGRLHRRALCSPPGRLVNGGVRRSSRDAGSAFEETKLVEPRNESSPPRSLEGSRGRRSGGRGAGRGVLAVTVGG
ncbi:hypothetical protein EYF80_044852 [Liparis tanakae]|uniref:Uncharacterized protein n=1 Tax=Liparis tanakae TaxID=230148 RepID=A0A4Z2FVN1_9TELE|nr:hypothetical protein EYF80_044852 [Liparis tanakae]